MDIKAGTLERISAINCVGVPELEQQKKQMLVECLMAIGIKSETAFAVRLDIIRQTVK